jgi:nucleoside-diphosphate-sugar epimerase
MKIVVTGGSGRAVVEMARAEGHQVLSVDRVTPPPRRHRPARGYVCGTGCHQLPGL